MWLAEVSANPGAAALKSGEHLVDLAVRERKLPNPPNRLADWLYELRDRGMIAFDDTGVASVRSPGQPLSANDLFVVRFIALTEAGRARLKSDHE